MRRKRLAIILASVLFASIILISLFLISTVRNVTVEYVCSTQKTEQEIVAAKSRLEQYLGKNVFTVDEDAVKQFLADNPYVEVVSVKRKLTFGLNVSIKEREEAFCVLGDGRYYTLTKDCFVLAKGDVNATRGDGLPHVLIDGDVFEGRAFDVNAFADVQEVMFSAAVKILNAFTDVRNELVSVTIDRYNEESGSVQHNLWNRIRVKTGEGAIFTVYEADKLTEEKIALLKRVYDHIYGEDRVVGEFIVFEGENSTVDYEKL